MIWFSIFALAAVGFFVLALAIQTDYNRALVCMGFSTALALVAGFILVSLHEESQQCIAGRGAQVQWREYNNVVRENLPMVFLTLHSGGYCKVASQELYNRGVGYTTDRIYTGTLYGAKQ